MNTEFTKQPCRKTLRVASDNATYERVTFTASNRVTGLNGRDENVERRREFRSGEFRKSR